MQLPKNIPKVLYKYRVWEEIGSEHQNQRRILTETELYFASADQFNDPFDTVLPLRYKDEDLTKKKLFKKLWKTGLGKWPDISKMKLRQDCYDQINTGRFENDTYWEQEYPKYKENNLKTFGIISLSHKNDNLLMWSHYSNSHNGFCVGLDTNVLNNLISGSIVKINYQIDFPKVPLFAAKDRQLIEILRTKFIDWKYEAEWRFIKIGVARKVYKFPENAVLEVILGYKMDEVLKQTITNLVKTNFPNARIYQSNVNKKIFKLDIIPI